jgi:hypothetical protein
VATQPAAETAQLATRPATIRRPSAGSGIAIAVIAGAQLMVALDVTIVNIALPHIQAALHFSRPSLVLSAVLSVLGIGALVYGFLHAASDSWRSPVTIAAFFVPLAGTAVAGVTDHDAGIASAAYNMFFQIGGAIGLAALTTVASTAIRNDLASHAHPGAHAGAGQPAPALLAHALAHGWGTAFAAGAGFAMLALLVALAVVRVRAGEINPAHVH